MQISGASSNSQPIDPLGPTNKEVQEGLSHLKDFADKTSKLENSLITIYDKYSSFNMSTSSGEADAAKYTASLYKSGAFKTILNTVNEMASNPYLLGLSRESIKNLFPVGGEAGEAISTGENFGNLLTQMQSTLGNMINSPPSSSGIVSFVSNLEDNMYSWFQGKGTEYAGLTPTIAEATYLVNILENSHPKA